MTPARQVSFTLNPVRIAPSGQEDHQAGFAAQAASPQSSHSRNALAVNGRLFTDIWARKQRTVLLKLIRQGVAR